MTLAVRLPTADDVALFNITDPNLLRVVGSGFGRWIFDVERKLLLVPTGGGREDECDHRYYKYYFDGVWVDLVMTRFGGEARDKWDILRGKNELFLHEKNGAVAALKELVSYADSFYGLKPIGFLF